MEPFNRFAGSMNTLGIDLQDKAKECFRSPAALTAARVGPYRGTSTIKHDSNTYITANDHTSKMSGEDSKISKTVPLSRRTPSKIRTTVDRKLFNALADASAVSVTVTTPKAQDEACHPELTLTNGSSFFCGSAFSMIFDTDTEPIRPMSPNNILPEYVPGLPQGINKDDYVQHISLADIDVEERDDFMNSNNVETETTGRVCPESPLLTYETIDAFQHVKSQQHIKSQQYQQELTAEFEVRQLTSKCYDESKKTLSFDSTKPGSVISITVTPPPRATSPAQFKYTQNLFSQFRTSSVLERTISQATPRTTKSTASVDRSFAQTPPAAAEFPMSTERMFAQETTTILQNINCSASSEKGGDAEVASQSSQDKTTDKNSKVRPALTGSLPGPKRTKLPPPRIASRTPTGSAFTPKSLLSLISKPMPFFEKNTKTDQRKISAAKTIQCLFRKRLAKRNKAALSITQFFKALLFWKKVHAERIQRVYRRHLRCKTNSAVLIQSFWRQKQARKELQAVKDALAIIQNPVVSRVMTIRAATQTVQHVWRRALDKMRAHKVALSILKLQSCFRAWMCQKQLRKAIHSAVKIQRMYRNSETSSSVKRIVLRILDKKSKDAITIQSLWRAFKERQSYKKLRSAMITLQALSRCKYHRLRYLNIRTAIVTIQNKWRVLSTSRTAYAIVIQAQARRMIHCQRYTSIRRGTPIVQKYWRGYKIRLVYRKKLKVIREIQSFFRVWKARIELERKALQSISLLRQAYMDRQRAARECAAVTIQKYWRRKSVQIEQQKLSYQHQVMTEIQRCWRGYKCRKNHSDELMFLRSMRWRRARQRHFHENRSAIRIQKQIRGHICRRRWQLIIRSVKKLQILVLRFLAMHRAARIVHGLVKYQSIFRGRKVRQSYQNTYSSIIKMQNACRMHLAKRTTEYRRSSIIKIQQNFRCFLICSQYNMLRQATVKAQSLVRQWSATRYCQLRFCAVLLIQSAWRGSTVRRHVTHWHEQATKIQSMIRRFSVRRHLHLQAVAATHFQRLWRGRSTRRANFSVVRAIRLLRELIESRKQVERWNAAAKAVQLYWDSSSDGQGVGVAWPENINGNNEGRLLECNSP